MNEHIRTLTQKIHALELQLEAEVAKRHAELRFGLERGRIKFEEEVRQRHKELKTHLLRYVLNARPLVVLTAPVIYALIIPLVLLDLSVSIYQAVCFRAYGIARVRRRDYLVFDRHYLAYLNLLEKVNCAYCSYANGVIAFVREVAARTEQHWCPIKHARRVLAADAHYREVIEFGDAEAYRAWLARTGANRIPDEQSPDILITRNASSGWCFGTLSRVLCRRQRLQMLPNIDRASHRSH